MRYLVTGVTGQLGYDVVRILKENGVNDIYAPTSSEFDITNKEIVVSKTKEFNPDVIIHCAAYTKVDQAEIDTDTCYKVNVIGTKNMTEAAKEGIINERVFALGGITEANIPQLEAWHFGGAAMLGNVWNQLVKQ